MCHVNCDDRKGFVSSLDFLERSNCAGRLGPHDNRAQKRRARRFPTWSVPGENHYNGNLEIPQNPSVCFLSAGRIFSSETVDEYRRQNRGENSRKLLVMFYWVHLCPLRRREHRYRDDDVEEEEDDDNSTKHIECSDFVHAHHAMRYMYLAHGDTYTVTCICTCTCTGIHTYVYINARISIRLSTSICQGIEIRLPRLFCLSKRDKISEVKRKCRREIVQEGFEKSPSFFSA